MPWILKQSKSFVRLRSVWALQFVFFLAGLPLASRAQSSGTPLSDVTLEQFMSALEQHYVHVSSSDDPISAPFYVLPLADWNGSTFSDGYLKASLFGEELTVAESAIVIYALLRDYLYGASGNLSNTLDRISNALGDTFDNPSGYSLTEFLSAGSVWSGYTEYLPNAAEDLDFWFDQYRIGDTFLQYAPMGPAEGVSWSPAQYVLQTYDMGTPEYMYAHSGPLGQEPSYNSFYVQDHLVKEAVERAATDITSSIGQIFDDDAVVNMKLHDDTITDITNALFHMEFAVSNLAGRLDSAMGSSLAGQTNAFDSVYTQDSESFTNALTQVTNDVESVSLAVTNSFDEVQGDLLKAFEKIVGKEQGASSANSHVLTLIPSLDLDYVQPLRVDLADDRFKVGGWRLWEVLRAGCLLSMWVWWIVFFIHFIKHWSSRFASLIGS